MWRLTVCLHECLGPISETALLLQWVATAGVLSRPLQVDDCLQTTPEHINRSVSVQTAHIHMLTCEHSQLIQTSVNNHVISRKHGVEKETTVPLELFNYIIFLYYFSRRPCHS